MSSGQRGGGRDFDRCAQTLALCESLSMCGVAPNIVCVTLETRCCIHEVESGEEIGVYCNGIMGVEL